MRNFQFRILTILLSAIFSNYPHNTHNGKYSLLNPSSIHAVRNFQFRTIIILLSAIFNPLFIFQCFNRIGKGSLHTFNANGDHGDKQGYKTCQRKHPPTHVSAVSVPLQKTI